MLHAPISKTKTEIAQGKTQVTPQPERELHPHLLSPEGYYSSSGMRDIASGASPNTRRRQALARMQSTHGNQVVLRMLQGPQQVMRMVPLRPSQGVMLQRKCACGGSSESEGECAECKAKEEGMLQRQPANTHSSSAIAQGTPPIVHEVLRSPGQPLDASTRAFMEPRFGHDFSQVRVHTDSQAVQSAQAVNSFAYTVGRDIVFGAGQYAPETSVGKRVLAHELTHVMQQNYGSNGVQRRLMVGNADDAHEHEAERIAGEVTNEGMVKASFRVMNASASVLRRLPGSASPTPPGPTTKCGVDKFWAKFSNWNISWPGYFFKGTTIRLPVRFRVDLSSGSNKTDCLIGQRKKGRVESGGVDEFPSWVADGEIGHRYWWDGSDWHGGRGSWDLFGKDGADFYDEPGFNEISEDSYPLYWGGVGKTGCFEFETFIADKATEADVKTIKWGMLIDYAAPKSGKHSRC